MNRAALAGRLGGIAAGGIVLGHVMAYRLADPTRAARSSHLSRTGHGYFDQFIVIATAIAAVALLSACIRAFRSGPTVGFTAALGMLFVVQVSGFALQELSERGFNLVATAADPAVRIGVLVQFALALLIAFLVSVATKVARLAGVSLGRTPARSRSSLTAFATAGTPVISTGILGGSGKRAPPSHAFA